VVRTGQHDVGNGFDEQWHASTLVRGSDCWTPLNDIQSLAEQSKSTLSVTPSRLSWQRIFPPQRVGTCLDYQDYVCNLAVPIAFIDHGWSE
jgi:hypothetical protein